MDSNFFDVMRLMVDRLEECQRELGAARYARGAGARGDETLQRD